jgi:hypothetical protein
MKRTFVLLVGLALALALGAAGCARLESARPMEARGPGALHKQRLAARDAVPAGFGDLVGVTSRADYPNWAQAWFVKPDKSIVVVWINSTTGYMLEDALEIPRR